MASKKGKAGNATPRVVQFSTKDDQQNQQPQPAPIMFGALLKERRKKAQLSQKDFADMMHVTRNTVINWEADKSKPDYNLIPELCTLLNIQIHELFHMQAQTALSDLEDRVVNNLRNLSPTSRKVVDKMISTMVDEELMAKDQMMKETFELFLVRPGTLAAGTGDYVPESPRPTRFFGRMMSTSTPMALRGSMGTAWSRFILMGMTSTTRRPLPLHRERMSSWTPMTALSSSALMMTIPSTPLILIPGMLILQKMITTRWSSVVLFLALFTPQTGRVRKIAASWKTCLSMRSGSSMKSTTSMDGNRNRKGKESQISKWAKNKGMAAVDHPIVLFVHPCHSTYLPKRKPYGLLNLWKSGSRYDAPNTPSFFGPLTVPSFSSTSRYFWNPSSTELRLMLRSFFSPFTVSQISLP